MDTIYFVQDWTTGGRYSGAWKTSDEAIDILLDMRDRFPKRVFELQAEDVHTYSKNIAQWHNRAREIRNQQPKRIDR